MEDEKRRKYSGDEVITRLEDGRYSLLSVLSLNMKMREQHTKRLHGLKIAAWSCGLCVLVFSLIFAIGSLLSFRQTGSTEALRLSILLVLALLLLMIVTVVLCWFYYISKPQKQYAKALAQGYPGLNPQSEESIQRYIWSFEDDHMALLYMLTSWIAWKEACSKRYAVDSQQWKEPAPKEMTLLYVMRAIDIENFRETCSGYLFDLFIDAKYYESALREIGAFKAADLWQKALPLVSVENSSPDAELSREDAETIEDIARQLSACREETVESAYQYIMNNASAFR